MRAFGRLRSELGLTRLRGILGFFGFTEIGFKALDRRLGFWLCVVVA